MGTDLVEISRIASAMRNPRFLERILTPRELASRPNWSASAVAGRWAAKEAAAKAVRAWNLWHDVEVFNDEVGRPYLRPSTAVEGCLHCSISHERNMALATVIWERADRAEGSKE
ncbi:MAG: holo-ACP synthase [Chthonomonadaceae bacterium]|nr:holo-ACP synthase [Chthonomonadaceae bacterium]